MKRIIKFCVGLFVTAALSIHLIAQESTRLFTQPERKNSNNIKLKVKATLIGHQSQVYGLTFSPNGEFLATASYSENATRLWSTASCELIAALDGIAPEFSPDGQVLMTVRPG